MIRRGFDPVARFRSLVLASAAVALLCSVSAGRSDTDVPAYTAQGNEPFWSVAVDPPAMVLRRLDFETVAFTVTDTVTEAGSRTIFASAPDLPLTATLDLVPMLCRDTMTGLPYPDTARLALGDTVYEGCGGDPMDLLTGREWQVVTIAERPVPDGVTVTLAFDGEGRIAGDAGCNRFFAAASLTGEGLTLGEGATTRMACPEPQMTTERRFLDALPLVYGFDFTANGALLLLGPQGAVIETAAP